MSLRTECDFLHKDGYIKCLLSLRTESDFLHRDGYIRCLLSLRTECDFLHTQRWNRSHNYFCSVPIIWLDSLTNRDNLALFLTNIFPDQFTMLKENVFSKTAIHKLKDMAADSEAL